MILAIPKAKPILQICYSIKKQTTHKQHAEWTVTNECHTNHNENFGCWVSRLITATFAYRESAHWWYTFWYIMEFGIFWCIELAWIGWWRMDGLLGDEQTGKNQFTLIFGQMYICMFMSSEGFCDILSATTQWISRYKHLQICTLHRFALATVDYQPMVSMFASYRREHPSLIANHVSPDYFVTWWKLLQTGMSSKINFHLVLGNGRFSLDIDKKSKNYVYGE